jgi:hypothetical protein
MDSRDFPFYSGGSFTRNRMTYSAILFRGWEVVRLDYALEDDHVSLRRRRTFKGRSEERVELAALSGEVRRIRARQPAFIYSTVILVVVLLILGVDALFHGVGANGIGGKGVSWYLWGPCLAVAGYAWMVRFKTRVPAEWSHFVGTNKGGGLFVLRDPRNSKAHEKFVAGIRTRLPNPSSTP